MQDGLKELKHTQEKLHNMSHPKKNSAVNLAQVAQKLGITTQSATKEQIAQKMAQRMMAKVRKDKPASQSLVQLSNGNMEKIILEDQSNQLVMNSASEYMTLDNTSSVSPSPEENELLVEGMQDATLE